MNIIPHSSSDITKNDIESVISVLEGNFVGYGSKTISLEKQLGKFINADYVYAVNTGSSALWLAFKILNLPIGSKVITTSYSCVAIINSICNAGLIPTFVDLDLNTVNADVETIFNVCKSSSDICAIVFPHIGGYPSEISILKNLDIPIIEDCAASIGSLTSNGLVGALGDIAIFSFGSTKLITGGNGGAIAFNNRKNAEQMEKFLDYELKNFNYFDDKFENKVNERMSNLTAALTLSQLSNLDNNISLRRKYASMYSEEISLHDDATFPKEPPNQCSFWRYIFFSSRRDDWISHMKSLGIDAR